MEKIAACLKEKGNWGSSLSKALRMDQPDFKPEKVKELLDMASPKLKSLMDNIEALDQADMKKYGRVFKHFIYSDIKSAYGAKLMGSILSSYGFHHAYKLKKTPRGMSFGLDLKKEKAFKTFAILTSVSFFEKPIGVQFRRELLKTFNTRPDNNYGEKIRIMVLDSGFREGVDLFDVKYVHLMESITTLNDQKQAVGRATRFCGQKGLVFDPVHGWPLHVFRYETTIPNEIQMVLEKQLPKLKDSITLFDLFLKYSNLDPKKIAFANELEKVVIDGAADKAYTKNIHDFKVGGRPDYVWPPVKVENLCNTPVDPNAPIGASLVTFSPTQNFVRETFTPSNPLPGMLLFHSVGTGKTCTAIATATSSFEPEGYTLLYVTRYTLKADVWKNMFDQVCSVVVQDYLKSGKSIPEAQAAKKRLISKKWMDPISYRQLSNLLDGKNKLSEELIQFNGKQDPLRKTLLIIDEAHKLFAADVEGQEKADIEVVRKALRHSYETSGKDSVKVLLMTATPYTSDAMDMIRLLNLIRKKPFPEEFEDFSKIYLDETGTFSAEGLKRFQDEMKGVVSYLNREKDIRSFAYPIFKDIRVPISTYNFKDDIETYLRMNVKLTGKTNDYNNDKNYLSQELAEHRQEREKLMNQRLLKDKEKMEECDKELVESFKGLAEFKKTHQKMLKKCQNHQIECQKELTQRFKKQEKTWKAELKEASKKKTKEEKAQLKEVFENKIRNAKLDLEYDLLECEKEISVKECEEKAKEWLKTQTQQHESNIAKQKAKCQTYKDKYQEKRKEELEKIEKSIEVLRKIKQERHKEVEARLNEFRKEVFEYKDRLDEKIKTDVSQQMGIETCLKKEKYTPEYIKLLSGKQDIDDISEEVEALGTEKVYLISGHGSESIQDFKRRVTMPKGKVLVLFPECGRYNYISTSCKFQDMFSDPSKRKWLRNPIKYRSNIENALDRQIRIYLPGEKVPNLSTNLFLNVSKDKIVIAKSGVFRQFTPIDRDKFKQPPPHLNLGSSQCLKYAGVISTSLDYTTDVHREVFKGNVYPPASKGNSYDALENRNFYLTDILKEMGDGIYYYTGCRYSSYLPPNYMDVLRESEGQQDAPQREERIGSLPIKLMAEKTSNDEEDDEIIPPKKQSSEKKKEENPPKKKPIQLDPKLKKALIQLDKDIQDFYQEILEDESWIGRMDNEYQVKIQSWREELDDFKEVPIGKRSLATLDWIEAILTALNPPEKIRIEKVNENLQLTIGLTFQVKSTKHYLYDRMYGIIPKDLNYKSDKCNAITLAKRLETLFKNGKKISLPTQEKDWTPSKIQSVCEQTRSMIAKL